MFWHRRIESIVHDYVERNFGDWLREQGFVSGDGFYWYRLTGDGVVHSVIFHNFNRGPHLVAVMAGYQALPLFQSPQFGWGFPINRERISRLLLERFYPSETSHMVVRWVSPINAMLMPMEGNPVKLLFRRQLEPYFEQRSTIRDCYEAHMQAVDESNANPNHIRNVQLYPEVMEEMLWQGDEGRYPLALEKLEKDISSFEGQSYPDASRGAQYEQSKRLYEAFAEGKRGEYIRHLRERMEHNRGELNRRVGIG